MKKTNNKQNRRFRCGHYFIFSKTQDLDESFTNVTQMNKKP